MKIITTLMETRKYTSITTSEKTKRNSIANRTYINCNYNRGNDSEFTLTKYPEKYSV